MNPPLRVQLVARAARHVLANAEARERVYYRDTIGDHNGFQVAPFRLRRVRTTWSKLPSRSNPLVLSLFSRLCVALQAILVKPGLAVHDLVHKDSQRF